MEVNSNSAPNDSLGGLKPGAYLSQLRSKQKKSVADVAKELNILESKLEALERDDFSSLPEAPFIKGYYRSYAKFLGIDATPVIKRFDEIYSQDSGRRINHTLNDSPVQSMGKLASSSRRNVNNWLKKLIIFVVVLAVLFVLWGLVSQWLGKKKQAEAANTQGQVTVLPMSQSQTQRQSGDALQLEFSRPTSVKITDSTGKVLAQGRQAENLKLEGQAPFSIRIDDVKAVKLSLNNEEIALSRYANKSGVADFRLSP